MLKREEKVETKLYSAIFGMYDQIDTPRLVSRDVEYIMFTDRDCSIYPWRIIPQTLNGLTPTRAARKRKILSHLYVDTEYSVWVDGNIDLLVSPKLMCGTYLKKTDIAMFGHPHRRTIYEEAQECLRPIAVRDKPILINTQVQRYQKEGFSGETLMSTGVLLRRHTPQIVEFNEMWWEELRNNSHRDQLSFPYVAWKMGLKIMRIPGNIFSDGKVYYKFQHAGRPNQPKFA